MSNVLDYQSPLTARRPLRVVTPLESIYHVCFGVLLPIGCFSMAAFWHPLSADLYQSGDSSVYAVLLMTFACAWPFYPLLVYAMASLILMVCSPARAGQSVLIRLGIY